MSDEPKTPVQPEEELARLRREVAGLQAALAAMQGIRPVEGMPGDYDLLFETLAEALLVVRIRDGLILRANPCCRRLLGLAEGDLAGKTLYHFMPEAVRPRAEALLREAVAGNQLVPLHDVTYHRPDGTAIDVEIGGAILSGGPDAAALLYLTDITESRQARRLLQEAEQRYRLVVESAADPIFMFDRTGRFVSANPAAARALRRRPEDLVGRTMHELFPAAIADRQARGVRRVFETGQPLHSEENESQTAEGHRWYNTSLTPLKNEQGEVEYVLGIARDVTDRKRTEAALRQSEALYRAVVDSQTELVCRFAPDCRITFVNETVCRSTGLGREELVGASFLPYVPEPDRADLAARLAALSPQCPVLEDEHAVLTLTGEPRRYHWVNRGVFDEQGRLVEIQAVGRDVTEQRRAEEALRESQQELQAVQDTMVDGILIADVETRRFVRANAAVCRMLGYAHDELLTKAIEDVHPRDRLDEVLRVFESQVRGERTMAADIPCMRKDGSVFFAEISATLVTVDGRACEMGVFRDITERKKADEDLREREAELQSIQDAMVDALVIVDIETQRLVRINPAAGRMFGYAPEELKGMSVHAIHPPEDVHFTNLQFQNRAQGIFNSVSEIRCLRKDGTLFVADMNSAPIMIGDRRCTMGVFRDITERKKAEEALRQSEENYRLLFEESMLGIAAFLDNRIVKVNRAFCNIVRREMDRIVGSHPFELIAPEGRAKAAERATAILAGVLPEGPSTYQILRGDGTRGQVEIRSGRMIWEGKPAVLSMVQDVTQRVQLENELREAQKMEAVGQLAGGVAHDFNNLLTGILCSAQLMKNSPGAPKDVCETAEVIEKAARRAAELTSQLLGFARRGKHQDVPVDLGATVRSVIRLLGGAIDPRITVEVALPHEPVWIRGDPTQMEQVVLNLAMNARDAMADAGKLTVAAETVELDAAACVGRPRAKPGRYVVLRVSDTGCGINEEIHDRIFEPFFTTKPVGKGTGMGLAMVYGIARSHGGWVEVDSMVGKGSTFRVYLPALVGPLTQPPAGEGGGEREKGGRVRGAAPAKRRAPASAPRVLVVDDDEMVRKAMTRTLASGGYSVVTAASGREAVDTYGMFGSSIDVVIIDMAMPDMDGLECFQALRRQNPHVRAILCTGGPADEGVRDAVGKGLVDFIPKPYRFEQLAAAIEKALATRGDGPPEAPLAPRP